MLRRITSLVLGLAIAGSACGSASSDGPLVVYSGRGEELVGGLITQFEQQRGVEVEVRYGDSPELAATLLEEGNNSPADVFFAQDPASLGVVAKAGLLQPLPDDLLGRVPERFRDGEGRWVGVSGRARTMVYNTEQVDEPDLPADIWGFVQPEWKGRLGVAPTNGSFLAFVASLILTEGEDRTRAWLEGLEGNEPLTFAGNSEIVAAVENGEIDAGFVNHYYLLRLRAEQGGSVADNHFLTSGDAGALVMPAGAGLLATSRRQEAGRDLIAFLLSEEAQRHFAQTTFEYPLIEGVPPAEGLPPLEEIAVPTIELSDLADVLDLATDLVAEAGLL